MSTGKPKFSLVRDIVAVLLDHGAKADAKTRMGSTLLHDASLKGHADLVTLLLDHGAPVNLRNANGSTALHDAALGEHEAELGFIFNQ